MWCVSLFLFVGLFSYFMFWGGVSLYGLMDVVCWYGVLGMMWLNVVSSIVGWMFVSLLFMYLNVDSLDVISFL